jgi:hypothetical protein
MDKLPNFWKWLFQRDGTHKSGIIALADRWLILHMIIGILAAIFLGQCFVDAAKNVIIPFASVLTGITFAWSGNITALLTTRELGELTRFHKDGIKGYVFTVQRSIFIVFVALISWVFVGLDIISNAFWRFIVFTISSAAIRESWGVIMFAQMLTIYREKVADASMNSVTYQKDITIDK